MRLRIERETESEREGDQERGRERLPERHRRQQHCKKEIKTRVKQLCVVVFLLYLLLCCFCCCLRFLRILLLIVICYRVLFLLIYRFFFVFFFAVCFLSLHNKSLRKAFQFKWMKKKPNVLCMQQKEKRCKEDIGRGQGEERKWREGSRANKVWMMRLNKVKKAFGHSICSRFSRFPLKHVRVIREFIQTNKILLWVERWGGVWVRVWSAWGAIWQKHFEARHAYSQLRDGSTLINRVTNGNPKSRVEIT